MTADAPVAGGKAMFGVGYVDAELTNSVSVSVEPDSYSVDADLKRFIVSLGYDYPFSKRTDIYAVASYSQDQVDFKVHDLGSADWDPSTYTFYVGLRHRF